MKSNNHESNKRRIFDAFCKRVLKNEVRNHYNEMERLRNKEVSFSELTEQELEPLAVTDEYFVFEQTFNVLGDEIIVQNEQIAEALKNLPESKRDIILLSYFLELSDGEIGEKLNLIRSTVQYQRTSTLKELKKYLKGDS